MSMPESGFCSLEDYEAGKKYLVTPERLCLEGLYTLASSARLGLAWKACLFPVTVDEVTAIQTSELHKVSVSFDDESTSKYVINDEGLALFSGVSPIREVYLRHRFEEVDLEKDSIEEIETVPFRVATAPFVIPTSV